MILEPSEDYKAALTNTLSLKGRKLQKYNLLKFRVICAVLDYMSVMNGSRSQRKPYVMEMFQEEAILQLLINNNIISLKHKQDRAHLNMIFSEMKLMGLIEGNNGILSMTPYTIEAYHKQTFHQIYASLLAAEDSRTLGLKTLLISVLAIIITLVLFVVKPQ